MAEPLAKVIETGKTRLSDRQKIARLRVAMMEIELAPIDGMPSSHPRTIKAHIVRLREIARKALADTQ